MATEKYYPLEDYNLKILEAFAFPMKVSFTPIIKKNVWQLKEKEIYKMRC